MTSELHPETTAEPGAPADPDLPVVPGAPDRRSRMLAFGALLIAGLGALITGSQPWWRARGGGTPVTFTGVDATAGLTAALAVVILAGTLLALALRRIGRRVVALILALAGLGTAAVGLLRLRPGAAEVTEKVRQVSLMDDYRLVATPWSYLYAAAGALAVAGAVVMVLRAGRWPQRADRFSRGTPAAQAADITRLADPAEDPSQWWKAQDAGLDPSSVTPAPSVAPADEATGRDGSSGLDSSESTSTKPES